MGVFFTINMKLEHIGIAVKDLKSSTKLFSELFDQESYKLEEVQSEGVRTSFFRVGESKVELLEGTTSESPISKFIDKKGEGIHHLAFEVKDLEAAFTTLEERGATPTCEIQTVENEEGVMRYFDITTPFGSTTWAHVSCRTHQS